MVNVSGRSKGCQTCLKRRIKCDEGKPACQRCSKAGYHCSGYSRPLVFRNSSSIKISPSSQESGVGGLSLHGTVPTVTTQSLEKHCSPPPELSLVAFQGDICFAFLLSNFVWRTFGTPWLELAAQGTLGQLSFNASEALSFSNFGALHHRKEIQLNGSIQYSQTLRTLAPLLSDCGKCGVEELIFPIMILLVHASSQSDLNGSLSHLNGLAQLLLICGPQRFQREPLRSAFESCRATFVTAGFISRRRSFMEQQSWQTIPWAVDRSLQSSQSQLSSILIFVPGFLEDETQLDQHFDSQVQQGLVKRIEIQLERLFQWRWRWEIANAPKEDTDQAGQFGHTLEFANVSQATDIMTYDAALMWLLRFLWKFEATTIHQTVTAVAERAQQKTSHDRVRRSHLHLPGESVLLRDAAIEICRAFYFLVRNIKTQRVSSLFFLMPVGLAWNVLQQEEEWKNAIAESLAFSEFTSGYATGQNVFGFGFYSPWMSELCKLSVYS